MAGKKEIRDLSDFELLSELKSLGLKIGPISPTTRRIYERKLSKARGCDVVDSTNKNRSAHDIRETGNSTVYTQLTGSTTCALGGLESPTMFYGVCFDVSRSCSEGEVPSVPAVFTSKEEALKAAKKCKGARFKGFKTRVEAEGFSRSRSVDQEDSSAVKNSMPSPTDPVSNFKGPTPQELVKFRNVIERGLRQEFLETVLKNPRYLIGPGDTPVILQEGFRYNAIHVAVKNNRKDMCKLIIDTLESQHFWNILFSQESQSLINDQRIHFLVDMYLNTPDKGNLETPLHFACKFGHVEVVEYLVSHPLTDIQRANKYGETPAQVICSRCNPPRSEVITKIKSCLEDNFYVPLLGSVDNSTPSWIGEPWSPEVTCEKGTREETRSQGSPLVDHLKQNNSPGEPPVICRAYAGPMSPSKAERFFHTWKTPTLQEQRNCYIQIKRTDDSRGTERIGRELAHNERIPWTEYWNFLGSYADLSSSQGLKKLEDYLCKKKDRIVFRRLSVTPQRIGALKSSSSIVPKTPESRKSSVVVVGDDLPIQMATGYDCDVSCDMNVGGGDSLSLRKSLFGDATKEENLNITLQDSKLQIPIVNAATHSPPLQQASDVNSNEPVQTLAGTLNLLFLNKEDDEEEDLHDLPLTETPDKQDVLNSSASCLEERDGKGIESDSPILPCKKKLLYSLPENSRLPFKTEDYSTPGAVPMEADTQIRTKLTEENTDIEEKDNTQNTANEMSSSASLGSSSLNGDSPSGYFNRSCYDDDVFLNASDCEYGSAAQDRTDSVKVESPGFKMPLNKNLRHVNSESYSCVHGSASDDFCIFIQGLQPSKLDLDVLLAIGQTKIDSVKYPSIARWKKLVMSYSEEKQQSWPSPGSPRYNLARYKSLKWSC